MAIWNLRPTGQSREYYGSTPYSTPLAGGSSGTKQMASYSTPLSGGMTPLGTMASGAASRSAAKYDTPEYQTEMAKQTGLTTPYTYGKDPSKLGKTTKLSDMFKAQGGTSSAGGAGIGGGVVSSGASNTVYDTAKMDEIINDYNKAFEEAKTLQGQDKEAALADIQARMQAYSDSPVFQAARAAATQLMSGGLTESQKAAVGSEMRSIAQKYGQAALARGFSGSGMAGSQIATAQGAAAQGVSDTIRQNMLEGIQSGGALESTYQGGLDRLATTMATEIRPTNYQLPDLSYLETIGRAYGSSASGTASNSGTWQRLNAKYDVTKGERSVYGYATSAQTAEQQRLAGLSQTERMKEEQATYRADLERRRKEARAKKGR